MTVATASGARTDWSAERGGTRDRRLVTKRIDGAPASLEVRVDRAAEFVTAAVHMPPGCR